MVSIEECGGETVMLRNEDTLSTIARHRHDDMTFWAEVLDWDMVVISRSMLPLRPSCPLHKPSLLEYDMRWVIGQ